MRFSALISASPVSALWPAPSGTGARLVFEGLVRPMEGASPIRGLLYEAYMPMAQLELARLAGAVCVGHGLLRLDVIHRCGLVPVDEASVVVAACSAHRAASLDAIADFLDRMKRDVPIWKSPVR